MKKENRFLVSFAESAGDLREYKDNGKFVLIFEKFEDDRAIFFILPDISPEAQLQFIEKDCPSAIFGEQEKHLYMRKTVSINNHDYSNLKLFYS